MTLKPIVVICLPTPYIEQMRPEIEATVKASGRVPLILPEGSVIATLDAAAGETKQVGFIKPLEALAVPEYDEEDGE